MAKRTYNLAARGLTLVEMMVAVGITVIMLLIMGAVFKSASDASGTAIAQNELMAQVQAGMGQLRGDLEKIRPDMPLAIVFEGYTENFASGAGDPGPELTELEQFIRYDRLVFFATGDYQDAMGGGGSANWPQAGNLARIFYGQMLNSPQVIAGSEFAPNRQILSRRVKIMTGLTALDVPTPYLVNWPAGLVQSPAAYDWIPYESAPVALWQQAPLADYEDFFLNADEVVSFVRRPDCAVLQGAGVMGMQCLQELMLLPDVTDVRVQVWCTVNNMTGKAGWFPDDQEYYMLWAGNANTPFGLCWNTPLKQMATPMLTTGSNNEDVINWFAADWDTGGAGQLMSWPEAIKVSFTVHDKNRARFAEGQRFSVVVKLPEGR